MTPYVNYTSNKKPKFPKLQNAAPKAQGSPIYSSVVGRLLNSRTTTYWKLFYRAQTFGAVICTLMYSDIVPYKRADRAINKGIVFPSSPVIASLALIIQFLVFTVWHLYYVLHSNSTCKDLYGKLFLPNGNCHQNNPS